MEQKIENWNGHNIRYVQLEDGSWWAVLKDICDVVDLSDPSSVSQRVDPKNLTKAVIKRVADFDSGQSKYDIRVKVGDDHTPNTREMLLVNEAGTYQIFWTSRKLEARQFLQWSSEVICKLRSIIGLKQFESYKLLNKDIQKNILWYLDALYWDEERKEVMISVTVQGGDVEQYSLIQYEKMNSKELINV